MSEKRPEEVFSLLADGTRVEILAAVAQAQAEREGANAGPAVLQFSEIYDRVDVDGTSKLSYHLGELTGTFLRKTGDGYAFTHAGERLVRFVLSGNYGDPAPFDPIDVAGTCLHCGAERLVAALDEQFFLVRCRDCERPVTAYHVSPAQTRAASGDELVDRIVDRQTAELELARRGACPVCAGRLSTEVRPIPDEVDLDAADYVRMQSCEACLRRLSNPLPIAVAFHPAAITFHWEHGLAVTTKGVWELAEHLREDRWTAERTPERSGGGYEVVYRQGDDALRLRLDEAGAATGTERVRHRTVDGEES